MKYCSKCGKELVDEAVICIGCGCSVANNVGATVPAMDDKKSLGYALLGFFFPIVGLILWLVWKDTWPMKAKSAGKGALISAIIGVFLSVLLCLFYIVIICLAFAGAGFFY